MPQQKLPPYFKEYLDEKFELTFERIDVVDGKVGAVSKEIEKMNGSIMRIETEQTRVVIAQQGKLPVFDKLVKDVRTNRKLIIGIIVFMFAGVFILAEESREAIMKSIPLLIGGL